LGHYKGNRHGRGLGTTLIAKDGLRLAGDTANVDLSEYHIKEVGRIVGILVAMLQRTMA
jgi:hypothetical protein